ncbi:MAG: hypothetical protein QXT77_05710 [Candidatus Methanomethylicaceae archaeon]
MPSVNEIINERLNRIDSIPDKFINGVGSIQAEIFAELIAILGELNLGESFVLNEANLARIEDLMNRYYQSLRSGKYGQYVSWYISQIDEQKNLIDEFANLEYNAAASAVAEGVFLSSKKIAIRQLLGDDFKTNFINVVRDNLISSIEGQANFTEMVQNMSALFDGQERNAQMLNWTKQIASDRFAITDRAYGAAIATELDLVFFQYLGGLVKDSRKFCIDRVNKFFHVNEARAWAKLDWAGKFRNTNEENILQWCGGWRCNHVPVFRSLSSVPRVDIERNISNGNFTPSKAEKSLLNL